MAFVPPIPQDPSYHSFADQRTILGIRNFWNLVSNGAFLLAGALGPPPDDRRLHVPAGRDPWRTRRLELWVFSACPLDRGGRRRRYLTGHGGRPSLVQPCCCRARRSIKDRVPDHATNPGLCHPK